MPKIASFEPVEAKGRASKWVVNVPAKYSETGRRERHFFATKGEARTFCDQTTTRLKNYGAQAHVLTPGQIEQAVQAFEKLKPYGAHLNTVVEEWITKRRLSEKSISFEKLLEEFEKAGRHNRPRSASYRQSIRQVRVRLGSLHGKLVSEITAAEVEEALRGMTASVRNYTLRILSCALNLGVSRGYLTESPIKKIEKAVVHSGEIAVYSPGEVAKILTAAEENAPELIPFLAISFFAGVRRSEMQRLNWSHVQLEEKYIRLPKQITKTGQGRHIPIEPNLAKWLERFASASGPVVPFSANVLRDKERDLRSIHKVGVIKHGPRHCYGSYWLATFENIDRLMLSLGHTDFETTQEHYAKAVTRKDATLFWSILPAAKEQRT